MKIYIIRHGESQATRDPTLFARMDPRLVPLTQWGYEQAIETGKALKKLYEDDPKLKARKLRVYYSPHLRIVQSKDGFLKGSDGTRISHLEETSLLREREHGIFHGLSTEKQRDLAPEIFYKLHNGSALERYITPMPEGESVRDVQHRMKDFLEKMKREIAPNEDVVIITHGGNCRALADNLTQYETTWLCDFIPPGTGDIIEVNKPGDEPGTAKVIHRGKLRTASMPTDYKAHTYGASNSPQEARI